MPIAPRHLWLLGLSGSGKSTVGPRLAQALHLPWIDTDSKVAQLAGKTIPEIFSTEGEERFRQRESFVLEQIASGPATVVSCGGGIILQESNRARMAATGLRIYLKSDPESLARRVHRNSDRPLLAGHRPEDVLARQLRERAPWYEDSEIHLDVTHLTPDQAVTALCDRLPAPWSR